MHGFTVIIPAKDEAELLPATLAGIGSRRHVAAVVVVDDGSRDGTADLAAAAGATVVRRGRSSGKAGALMAGADHALRSGLQGTLGVVLLDADVGPSVEGIDPLLDAVATGQADLAIAKYVARGAGGGRGRVVRLAREAIRVRSGWEPDVPLSGIRAMTWPSWNAVTPLARGWGVETAMTIDALQAGLRVVEVETTMTHRATGTDLRSKVHRARQLVDVRSALRSRPVGASSPSG